MKRYRTYLFLALFFFALFRLSETAGEKVRAKAVGLIPSKSHGQASSLEVENLLLKQQISRLKEWILMERGSEQEIDHLQKIYLQSSDPFFERRGHYLAQIIDRKLHSVPAKVIFRSPESFSSSVWINVGERENEELGFRLVAPNSPVVLGKAAIGVVQQVEKDRSLVRLLTDPALHVSVRVVRQGEQDLALLNDCQRVATHLGLREDLENASVLKGALEAFCEKLNTKAKGAYLAKGQLHGAARPTFRSMGQILKGEGFQYDFADEEGPSRDLRTGRGVGEDPTPLIGLGDLLVTTGLDGVFPPDLHVAIVTKIFPLNEGQCSFELEAKALSPSLSHLQEVLVLSPL